MSHQFMSYTSDTKLTSHVNCAANVSCELHPYFLQRTRSPPGPCLPKTMRNTHLRNYDDLKGKDTNLHFLFFHNIIPLLKKSKRKCIIETMKTHDSVFHAGDPQVSQHSMRSVSNTSMERKKERKKEWKLIICFS